jgi:hypothetical protein
MKDGTPAWSDASRAVGQESEGLQAVQPSP